MTDQVHKDIQAVKQMFAKHDVEDRERQSIIEQELMKHKEIMAISGEHMSHIRKDLTELKLILETQNKDSANYRLSMHQHMERVEPFINKYEQEKVALAYNKLLGEKVVEVSKIVLAIGAIGGAIIWAIRKAL